MFFSECLPEFSWYFSEGLLSLQLDAAADGTQCGEKKVRCQWGARLRKEGGDRGLMFLRQSWGGGPGEELFLGEWGSSYSQTCQRERTPLPVPLEPALGTGN